MKLLILDDEVLSVEIMKKQVNWENAGIDELFIAYNAEEARDVVSEHHIDIILCDIEMPGDSGIEFMRWAREQGHDMTCIFLTCHAKFEYAQEAVRLGSMDYLLLPVPYDKIEAKVRDAVKVRAESQKNAQVQEMGRRWIQNQRDEIVRQYGDVKSKEGLAAEADAFIHDHMADTELSVSMVAEHLNISADYLGEIFKQEKGTTVNKYIVKIRMDMAAMLIREGNLSYVAIAEQVGYENYSYFSSSFKKMFGCSPASYAKKSH